MKALQIKELNQLELIETEPPQIAEDELLIRTGATTICTSDVNDLRHNPFGIQLPVVIGHEGAGTVAATGSRVKGFREVTALLATRFIHAGIASLAGRVTVIYAWN